MCYVLLVLNITYSFHREQQLWKVTVDSNNDTIFQYSDVNRNDENLNKKK